MFEFTWNPDPEAFRIGSVVVRWYGLCLATAVVGNWLFFRYQVLRAGGTENQALEFLLIGTLGIVVGGRLVHVIFYDPLKGLTDPLWVLQFWQGGLASHGAALGGFLAFIYYARRHRQSFMECVDRYSYGCTWGAALVRVGNWFNSEVVGRFTDQTWGVRFPVFDKMPHPPLRHPSQLYEIVLGFAALTTCILVDRAFGKDDRPRGLMAATATATYFTGRFFVEFFKEYQSLSPIIPLTMGQWLSVPAALAGYIGLWYVLKKRIPSHWNTEPPPAKKTESKWAKAKKTAKKSAPKKRSGKGKKKRQ